MQERIKIGITQGDINSISYEVILKALADKRMTELCTPVIFGSPKVASYHKKALELEYPSLQTISGAREARPGKCYIINTTDEEIRVELGRSTPMAGESSYSALKAATDALEKGEVDALVTGPINKHNIQQDDFRFSGHTEFLQWRFKADESLMLMISEQMKVGLVTAHIPVNQLSSTISEELILDKLEVLNASLKQDFAIRKPRIALLGLNPHSGDEGLLGHEEQEVIIPAIEKANEKGILAFGPYAADGFFGAGQFSRFDATLAMYHDQGLAPFKALSMDRGVNYTAGLPVIRTSPAHGTAMELAGKNQASEDSFRRAIYEAIDISRNRREHREINRDPLSSRAPRGGRDESPEDVEKQNQRRQ